MNRFFFDARTARVTSTILLIVGVLGLAYVLRQVLLLAAISLFFAYLLLPLVRLTERRVIGHRPLAIVTVYLVLFGALGGAGAAIGPRLSTEVQSLAQKLPEMSKQVESGAIVGSLLQRQGWEWPQIRALEQFLQAHMGEIFAYAQGVTTALLKWLAGAWVIVLVPVFAFFVMKDLEQVTAAAIARLRHRGQRGVGWRIAEDLHLLLGQYVRAQVLLALITFIGWSAVFLLAGVPYALVLAGVGGALEVIPVVGPLTAGVVAIGVSLSAGYAHPWLLATFVLVWRGIQDYVFAPLVMARGIEIHPALMIVGVLAGGEIAGVAGMFLSVPIIAAARIVWRHLRISENGASPSTAEPRTVTVGREDAGLMGPAWETPSRSSG